MKNRWLPIAVLFGFMIVAIAIVLVGIYPYRPESLGGWMVLSVLALPAVLLFEGAGQKLFHVKWIARLGSVGRVIYGVLVMGSVLLILALAFQVLAPSLTPW